MKLLNIFERSKLDQQLIDSFRKIHRDTLEEIIMTLSHYENHILAAALFKAVTLINLLDPNQSFVIDQEDLNKQDDYKLIDITYLFVDMANNFYVDNRDALDNLVKKHLH